MTGPVIKLPTVGQEISEGLAPFINALMQRQQMQLQQQQLATQQAVAQANIAHTRAQTEKLKIDAGVAAQERKDEADAAKALQEMLEASNGEFTQDGIFKALAGLKSPGAIGAFVRQIPGLGAAASAPAGVTTAEAGAREAVASADTTELTVETVRAEQQLRQEAVAQAREFLRNPNARFSSDPTRAEAVGAALTGTLPILRQIADLDLQNANEDAQGRMLARQMAMQAYTQAVTTYNKQGENGLAPGDPEFRTLETILDELGQPIGQSARTIKQIVDEAFKSFGVVDEFQVFTNTLTSEELQRAAPVLRSDRFRRLDPGAQLNLVEAAKAIARGDMQLNPNGGTPQQRAIVRQLLRALVPSMKPIVVTKP